MANPHPLRLAQDGPRYALRATRDAGLKEPERLYLEGRSTGKRLIEFPLEEVGSIVVEVDELKFREAERQRRAFEERYRMDFETFEQAWDEGHITDKHTYEAECDYWEWEAAVTDEERLRQMLEELL